MARSSQRRPGRGTSLVEALVAMAVMAFGMLAVLGVQATLRLNADVAKQRSEAVRIAQDAMETSRSFATIDVAAGQSAYADILNAANVAVVGYTTNTNYTLTQDVVAKTAPDRKELRIRVDWIDRNGQPQQVELNSVIGANDPGLSRALGAQPRGIPVRKPMGRHPAIPPEAKLLPGGELSAFKPPSPNGLVVWVFDNLTGVIVGVCDTVVTGQAELTGADVQNCSDNKTAQLLSGFVRFATDLVVQATASDAEFPAATALNLSIGLVLTSVGHPVPSHACFAAAPPSAALGLVSTVVPYYCAIFSNVGRVWSGMSSVIPLGFSDQGNVPWVLAGSATDATSTRYRVCRYTPAASDADVIPNWQHPRVYSNVTAQEPLTNQNFLIIRAGDAVPPAAGVHFHCPTDVASDPAAGDLVNSNTLPHQPAP